MSNMEEEKEIVTQDVGECGCNQNAQGRRGQHMPQFAPQQGGRRQYGQPFGSGVQSGQRMPYGRPEKRPPVSQFAPSSGRRPGEFENRASGHEHNVNGKKLLEMIDKASFAMDDTRLFLDTHPDSKEAAAYFRKMEKIRNEAIKEYEIHCGPILSYHTSDVGNGSWNWNEGPLPWNNDCCDGRRM